MKGPRSYVAVATLFATVNARNLALPDPTGAVVLPLDGISPKPTAAPVGLHELLRRQQTSTTDETVLVAPDNTCGYISGRPGAGYTCAGDATCVFFTSATTRSGAIACCNSAECNLRVTCVDYEGYFSSSQCDGGCEVDAFTLKCTETSAPYCNTIAFDNGGIRDFWCNNIDITTAQNASTTYRGETGRTFSPLALTESGSSSGLIVTSASVSGGGGPSASVDTSEAATATDDADDEDDDDDDGGSKTPVGPIVGGVVGGVGALGLAGLAVFFFLRNKKKKQAAAAAGTNNNQVPPAYTQPPMQQQQPGTGPGGYNPVPQNQQPYYDPKNPYPSPNSAYVQPNNGAGGFYPVQNDPNMPTSPTGTTLTDPRLSQAPTSPSPSYAGYNVPGQQSPPQGQPGFQPQQTVIHEAPTTEHKNQTHELA